MHPPAPTATAQPPGSASTLERRLAAVNRAAAHLAHAALWLLALVVLYDVTLRSFNRPPVWGSEVSVYLMLTVAFLGAGHTAATGGHFRVTAIVGLMPPSWQRACHLAWALLGLAFAIAVTVGAEQLAAFAFQLNFRTPTDLKLPIGLLHGMVFVGGIFLSLALLQELIRALRGRPPTAADTAAVVE